MNRHQEPHSKKLKVALIGLGHQGRLFYSKLIALEHVIVSYVCDLIPPHTSLTNGEFYSNYQSIPLSFDAVFIVSPASSHFEIAKYFLSKNKHVFIEKPIAVDISQANHLIALANSQQLILQIGHNERFNPLVEYSANYFKQAHYIRFHRSIESSARASDVSVILDLMIHDLDILNCYISSQVKSVTANGISVKSANIDEATAHIVYESGFFAHLFASRATESKQRYIELYLQNFNVKINLLERNIQFFKGHQLLETVSCAELPYDVINKEILSFIESILYNKNPMVSGEAGRDALALALQIEAGTDELPLADLNIPCFKNKSQHRSYHE